MTPEFTPFQKLPRLFRRAIITEKIDGTNACIYITGTIPNDGALVQYNGFSLFAGSRTRWITPQDDNFGFAKWAYKNAEELLKLGLGHHFGEWWGHGIQRGYGLKQGDRRFSLFNTLRWREHGSKPDAEGRNELPACCELVPVLYDGLLNTIAARDALLILRINGSLAAPGFMEPEGIVVFHTASNTAFKATIDNDDKPKSTTV